MKRIATVFAVTLMTLSFAALVGATPEKAAKTGKACSECHGGIPKGPQVKK